MKTILVLLACCFTVATTAQVEVNANDIKTHIGDSIRYCGKVVSARVMERMTAAPAFLNVDGAYPDQVFTIVIWKDDRLRFTNKPEVYYTNKKVCVSGKLEKYRDQLQVVVHSENQLSVQE